MLEGHDIVEQALEVAKIEAEARLSEAEGTKELAASIEHSTEVHASEEPVVSEAIQIAEIEASRDVAVADILATSHEEGCCDTCRKIEGRVAQLEKELADHRASMALQMAKMEQKKEPEVEQVPVHDVKEKKPKEEKKKDEKAKFGKLYLG